MRTGPRAGLTEANGSGIQSLTAAVLFRGPSKSWAATCTTARTPCTKSYCTAKGELKKGRRTDRAALKPGTAVFVWNGKTYSHVGLYTGDNTVIEAMSTVNGVTTSRVTAGKWTHWGELAGVDYVNAGNEQLIMNNEQLKERKSYKTIRKGCKGESR
jgi:NlpC/P60 family.